MASLVSIPPNSYHHLTACSVCLQNVLRKVWKFPLWGKNFAIFLFMTMLSYMSESGGKLLHKMSMITAQIQTLRKISLNIFIGFFPCFCYQKDDIETSSVKKTFYLPITGLTYFTRGEKL